LNSECNTNSTSLIWSLEMAPNRLMFNKNIDMTMTIKLKCNLLLLYNSLIMIFICLHLLKVILDW